MKLPVDLRKQARGTAIRRVAKFTVYSAILCALLFVCFRAGKKTPPVWVKPLVYAAAVLLVSIVTGFLWNLRDRTFLGKVVKIKYRVELDSKEIHYVSHLGNASAINVCHFTVLLPDGKRKRWSMRDEAIRHTGNTRFAVGDNVFHLYGTPLTVRLSDEHEPSVYCAVCAEENKEPGKKCRSCGHTMIASLADIGLKEVH